MKTTIILAPDQNEQNTATTFEIPRSSRGTSCILRHQETVKIGLTTRSFFCQGFQDGDV